MLKHKHTVVVVVFILQWMGELENEIVFIFATFSFKPSENYIICADFERSFSDAQTMWSLFLLFVIITISKMRINSWLRSCM